MEIINILEKMSNEIENENIFFRKMKEEHKYWKPTTDYYNTKIIENFKKITALNIAILYLKSNEKND